MTHRLPTLYLLALLAVSPIVFSNFAWADSAPASNKTDTKTATDNTVTKTKKSSETYFAEGLDCLKTSNLICAKTAQASIPAISSYATLLAGNIAAAEQDFVNVLRLLLPLQADKTLNNSAVASLHASLAAAYDDQDDSYRALEQRVSAEPFLSSPLDIKANQARIWQSLTSLPKTQLIEMRGLSENNVTQGWIDLAIATASANKQAIIDWRTAYPDHPASDTIAQQFLDDRMFMNKNSGSSLGVSGKIALILPFSEQLLYPVADAIEQGFSAANDMNKNSAEIKIYPSSAKKEDIIALYQQALDEGAKYVVGPLTREETSTLSSAKISVPTLTLTQPDTTTDTANFYSYGLTVEDEVTQIIKTARDAGMQSATIVMSNSPLANRMAKAFSEAWTATGGNIGLPISIPDKTLFPTIKSQLESNPTDMIFLAANADEAREIRPFLNSATPTFGLSQMNDGLSQANSDNALNAIRFTEIPWVIDHNNEAYKDYYKAAADLPQGEMQRWFALGVDAYHLLAIITQRPNSFSTFNGLTGKISVSATGEIKRELLLGRFTKQGIMLESAP
ncbi:MAG TPA: penicillin-binding protein activator [Methylophilaceae bacterium]|jgi:hypothetical protein